MEAPISEDTYYLDGRPVPDAQSLWSLLQQALSFRRVFGETQGATNWYYGVRVEFYILSIGFKSTHFFSYFRYRMGCVPTYINFEDLF